MIFVCRSEAELDVARRNLAPSLDALRFTLAAVEAEQGVITFPDAPPEGGGGESPTSRARNSDLVESDIATDLSGPAFTSFWTPNSSRCRT